MKRALFLLVLLLSAGIAANAQFKFGLKAGMNIASVNVDDTDSKVGVTAGILGQYRFGERWAIQPEVLFNMQGFKHKVYGGEESLTFGYVSIPVMAQFYIIDGLSIELGPQVGILALAKSKIGDRPKEDVKDKVETVEVAISTGIAYELPSIPLGFFARFTAGLTEISKPSWGEDVKNQSFQLGAFVKF